MYVLGSESEREEDDMCVVPNDEGSAPRPSNKIPIDDWDEDHHTLLGMCAANLKRMSLGTNCDAPACIEANNMKT